MSGGLAGQDIRRVAVDEKGRVTGQTKLSMGVRIRDVRMGPDGHLYALTDEGRGRIFKIVVKK
jgi:glucose/arabinose dehydrogenase